MVPIPTDDEIMSTGCATLEAQPFAAAALKAARARIEAAPSWLKLKVLIARVQLQRRAYAGIRGERICPEEAWLEYDFSRELPRSLATRAEKLQQRVIKEAGLAHAWELSEGLQPWGIVMDAAEEARKQVAA